MFTSITGTEVEAIRENHSDLIRRLIRINEESKQRVMEASMRKYL
jgi:hypothetical protein